MKKTRFIPKIGESYWYIMGVSRISHPCVLESTRNEFQIEKDFFYNCYKTKTEAEADAKKIKNILKN